MTTAETPITVGQLWRRKKDGVLVRVLDYDGEWDDVTYIKTPTAVVRRHSIFGIYFRDRYDLVEVAS